MIAIAVLVAAQSCYGSGGQHNDVTAGAGTAGAAGRLICPSSGGAGGGASSNAGDSNGGASGADNTPMIDCSLVGCQAAISRADCNPDCCWSVCGPEAPACYNTCFDKSCNMFDAGRCPLNRCRIT